MAKQHSTVALFIGSPRRNGNCVALADRLCQGVRQSGIEPDIFFLDDLDIRYCDGCDQCRVKTARGCHIKDDMRSIYPVIRAAKGIVFASPVYWASVSGQTKVFLDRCYALGGPEGHDMDGKSYGIILTYAGRDPFRSGAINAVRSFQDSFGSQILGFVYGTAHHPGEIKANIEIMDKAHTLGGQIGKACLDREVKTSLSS